MFLPSHTTRTERHSYTGSSTLELRLENRSSCKPHSIAASNAHSENFVKRVQAVELRNPSTPLRSEGPLLIRLRWDDPHASRFDSVLDTRPDLSFYIML